MINVSDSYLKFVKKTLKSQGLNSEDYVTCFICKPGKQDTQILSTMLVSLHLFEDKEQEERLPFKNAFLYKKMGCWLASDISAFLFLVSRKITIDKNNKLKAIKVPTEGKNSLIYFIGSCLKDHVKKKKLSNKELSINLRLTMYQFNKILKGTFTNLSIKDMINISMEFEGRNNFAKRFVMIEKMVYQKAELVDWDDFGDW